MTATPARDALALLPRVRIVLVEPSHPGNIGAAARAMKVMGLRELVLVSPRWPDAPSQPEAIAFASGATDVLSAVRISSSFTDAIGDATLAVAVSARGREYGPPPQPPERIAELALDELAAHPQHRVAFVFGSERIGLSIEQAGHCQRLLSIPTDADYDSLNLAQAVQIVAYCLRRAALQRSPAAASAAAAAAHADQRSVEQLFEHLQRALIAVGYLDPRHPKKLMPRLRRLFSRTRLEVEEVDLLRGICSMMERRR